jgi:hypothetical protein
MDSTWFAVDEAGEVGFFDTNEGGAVPVEGFPLGGEAGAEGGLESWDVAFPLLQELAEEDPELASVLPGSAADLGDWLYTEQSAEFRLLMSLGIHVYFCAEQDALPYFRTALPNDPKKLESLPEHIRGRFSPSALPVHFRTAERIAPGEHVPVESWSGYWFDTRGSVHPTAPESRKEAEEARAQLHQDFPGGLPEPRGDYWENMKPFSREELIELLERLKAQSQRRVAEAEAKESMVRARARSPRQRGLARLMTKLFGLRR